MRKDLKLKLEMGLTMSSHGHGDGIDGGQIFKFLFLYYVMHVDIKDKTRLGLCGVDCPL
jgi:hypothetical protein